ncbi:xenotropic and polytropic retrovirus receptor 1 [Nematocida sp. AWRm80]|nr:xenotropic and polytropic retrovirus receptor 1 [Nematocida sp. AWRm80]
MKFSKVLKEKQVQEWRRKYIEYDELKGLIEKGEKEFFEQLDKEIDKVERFYKLLERGAERGLANLLELFPEEDFPMIYEMINDQWRFHLIRAIGIKQRRGWPERAKPRKRQKEREHRALEMYLTANKISKYREMNLTGFRKILKKYNKQNETDIGTEKMNSILERGTFSSEKIDEIMEFTRLLYKEITPERHRDKANQLVKELTEADNEWDEKSFFSGVFLTLSLIAIIFKYREGSSCWYFFLFSIDSMFISIGILMYICRKSLINFSLILGMSLKPHLRISKYLLLATTGSFIHGISAYFNVPWYILYLINIVILCMPFDILFKCTRYYFLRTMYEVFSCALLGKVHFRHFFFADFLVTLRTMLVCGIYLDKEVNERVLIIACINSIPLIIRIAQCLRRQMERDSTRSFLHMYNTGKYLLTLVSETLCIMPNKTPMQIWASIILMGISQTYNGYWDIFIDWMLGHRPKVFKKRTYVFASLIEVVSRGSNVLFYSLLATRSIRLTAHAFITIRLIFCGIEWVRRLVWGVIRLEVEHLNNCDQLKAISGPMNDLFYMENAR